MSTPIVILIVAAPVLVLWAAWVFNRLVALKVRAANAWSDIDVQLKRRFDLVPKLVEVVRGYAGHEAATLERAVEARGRVMHAGSVEERGRAESDLGRRTSQLVALAEAYPDLKADDLFAGLHEELVAVEDAIQSARRYYNAVVRDLNTAMKLFPASIVARLLRFRPREFFMLDDPSQAAAPAVRLERP